MRPRAFLLCAALASGVLLHPAPGRAHGGLPVSEDILWQDNTMFVPAQYWGIFVGTDGGDWRWICDEAINPYLLRQLHRGLDGTFYATDLSGLTLSKDGGCTWVEVAAPKSGADITQDYIDTLIPDPNVSNRAWATGIASGGQSALWRTDDGGITWQSVFSVNGWGFRGFALAPDGTVYALSVQTPEGPGAQLYVSMAAAADGGTNLAFTPVTLGALPAGTSITQATLMAVDGRMNGRAYLYFQGDTNQVLATVDLAKGTVTQLLSLQSPIFEVTTDVANNRLLISTGDGLYIATGTGAPQRSSALSRTQCTSQHNGVLYACSWNYMPDQAAVARSTDGGATFKKVFQYSDAKGLISCPATSSVGMACPASWAMYAPLLGINTPPVTNGDVGVMQPASSSGCLLVRGRAGSSSPAGILLAIGALLIVRSASARRNRREGAPRT